MTDVRKCAHVNVFLFNKSAEDYFLQGVILEDAQTVNGFLCGFISTPPSFADIRVDVLPSI